MWFYEEKEIDHELSIKYYGFIYCIEHMPSGKKYIGRKYFTKAATKQVKGKRKKIRKDSDWKDYWGSSARLVEDMARLGKDKFTREIIHLCKSRGETNYMEAYYQFKEGVLLKENNYNGIIQIKLGKGSVKDLIINE